MLEDGVELFMQALMMNFIKRWELKQQFNDKIKIKEIINIVGLLHLI
jgi:hypothetical protein